MPKAHLAIFNNRQSSDSTPKWWVFRPSFSTWTQPPSWPLEEYYFSCFSVVLFSKCPLKPPLHVWGKFQSGIKKLRDLIYCSCDDNNPIKVNGTFMTCVFALTLEASHCYFEVEILLFMAENHGLRLPQILISIPGAFPLTLGQPAWIKRSEKQIMQRIIYAVYLYACILN